MPALLHCCVFFETWRCLHARHTPAVHNTLWYCGSPLVSLAVNLRRLLLWCCCSALTCEFEVGLSLFAVESCTCLCSTKQGAATRALHGFQCLVEQRSCACRPAKTSHVTDGYDDNDVADDEGVCAMQSVGDRCMHQINWLCSMCDCV